MNPRARISEIEEELPPMEAHRHVPLAEKCRNCSKTLAVAGVGGSVTVASKSGH
jgi:hypothetical protein